MLPVFDTPELRAEQAAIRAAALASQPTPAIVLCRACGVRLADVDAGSCTCSRCGLCSCDDCEAAWQADPAFDEEREQAIMDAREGSR